MATIASIGLELEGNRATDFHGWVACVGPSGLKHCLSLAGGSRHRLTICRAASPYGKFRFRTQVAAVSLAHASGYHIL